MHILTFEFISKVDDPEAVQRAHQPIIDAMMESSACLGAQIMKARSRREPLRYMFNSYWRDRDEAMRVTSTPEMRRIHDKIYEVQSDDVRMGVWIPLYAKGIVNGEDVTDRINGIIGEDLHTAAADDVILETGGAIGTQA